MGLKEKIANDKTTNWLTKDFSKKEIEYIKKSAKHQACFSDLFDNMREATSEEKESVNEYIKSISKPTGINFYDIIK